MQAGSYGFKIEVLTSLDLASTQALSAVIIRPDATRVEKALTADDILSVPLKTVGVPIADGDLPIPGNYRVQIKDTATGREILSSPGWFYVGPTI